MPARLPETKVVQISGLEAVFDAVEFSGWLRLKLADIF